MTGAIQMAKRYLTDAYFDRLSLPAGETDKTFYDDKVTGLGLRFRAEGKPRWTLYYQRQGRQRRYVIGPRSLKLEAARDAAQLLQADIAKGVDILQVRKDERRRLEQDTFGQEKLEGPLFSVTVAHSKLIKPAELRAVDGVFRLH